MAVSVTSSFTGAPPTFGRSTADAARGKHVSAATVSVDTSALRALAPELTLPTWELALPSERCALRASPGSPAANDSATPSRREQPMERTRHPMYPTFSPSLRSKLDR